MNRIRKKDFNSVSGKKYDGMMGRCYRESDRSFKHYGSKGIKVCSAWIKDIETFRIWLKSELEDKGIPLEEFVRNSKSYILDRINTSLHYCPENCRITDPQTQSRNTINRLKREYISAEGEIVYV